MIIFVALATVLGLVAVGLIALPRLRPNGLRVTAAAWGTLACAGILLIASAVLYATLSHESVATASAESSVAAAGAPLIRVEVEVAPALAQQTPHAAVLYVFARDRAQGGPPLAVKRLQSDLPQTVELTAADAMIPGHGIADGEQVEVIARISPSGSPMDQSGDLSGQADYRVGRDGLVDVVIDHVTP
ncbi:MAG TPA: hypothetical protein VMD06_02550 [Steroidobacteraceae bacterium]|nr:hypothetical protein [Steroidobacteraceae bacterium]